jgi:hypothetical protein
VRDHRLSKRYRKLYPYPLPLLILL